MNSNYTTKQSGAALLTVLVVSIALLMLMTMSATILEQRLKLAEKSKQRFGELVAIKSEECVRSRLKKIYQKTGVSNQVQLTHNILEGPYKLANMLG